MASEEVLEVGSQGQLPSHVCWGREKISLLAPAQLTNLEATFSPLYPQHSSGDGGQELENFGQVT